MKGLYKTELKIIAALAVVFGIVGNVDFSAQLEMEAAEKVARPARVIEMTHPDLEPQRKLLHPLRCPAMWIAHSKYSWEVPRMTCVGKVQS